MSSSDTPAFRRPVEAEKNIRELITPEGVDLKLVLADASARLSAFVLDVLIILAALIGLTLAVVFGTYMFPQFRAADYLFAIWFLGSFLIRFFYFTACEMTPRAATPGKRIIGIRVTTRNGGPLSADAIFARNAMRELEIFLPLSFLGASATEVDAAISIAALVWCGIFLFFPLFNRDRLRVGDLIAGTWVVYTPKRVLGRDLSTDQPSIVFSREALDAYGIRELSVLEDVLRSRNGVTMAAVTTRIKAKTGLEHDVTPDDEFLSAYYAQLRGHLERKLLFGRRKRDKYDVG